MSNEPERKRARVEIQDKGKQNDDQGLKGSLLGELKRLQNALADILAKAQEHAKESLEEFVADKVRGMSAMIGHYFTTFQALDIMTRKDMEQRIGKLYYDEDVQDTAEDLFHVEDEWNAFLEDIDRKIKPMSGVSNTELVVGSYVPSQATVTDVQSERRDHVALVQSWKAEFDVHNGQVVVISFGNVEGARKWLQDTKCNFRMYVDPTRQLYSAFGLNRSVAKVWSISALIYYAEQKRAARKLVALFEEDDPTQMGGDFILDAHGKLALVHRSKVSTDRPSVEDLLKCLKSLNPRNPKSNM